MSTESEVFDGDDTTRGIPFRLSHTLTGNPIKILLPRNDEERRIAAFIGAPGDYPFEDFLHKATLRRFAWIGDNYLETQPGKLRLLLVSESFYAVSDSANRGENPSRELVSAYLDRLEKKREPDERRNWCAYYTRIFHLVVGRSHVSTEECKAFWSRVVFYHYIQAPVGTGPRQRPSDDAWASGKKTFERVIRESSPTHVIVLGFELWNHILKTGLIRQTDRQYGCVVVTPTEIPAMATKHPSAFMQTSTWSGKVRQFIGSEFPI